MEKTTKKTTLLKQKENVFKGVFIERMKNKDFDSFKLSHRTLLECIYEAMDKYSKQ